MTEADDNVVELCDLDQLFEDVLAGQALGPEAPAWSADLARLVHGARVEAVPGELAGHDTIVARMLEARQAAISDAAARHRVAQPPLPIAVAVPSEGADAAPDPPRNVGEPHVPRHVRGEGGYRAKHAAVRAPASSTPTARHVGRLIAVKAAAVTTALVVGTMAAAAATSEIVANVVVPTFVSKVPDSSPATKTTTPQRTDRGGGGAGEAGDHDATVAVPVCQFTPVCSPLTPAGPGSDDPVPARPTGPTVPTTERPSTSTTTTEPPATTTTTADTTTTTEPEPTTTSTTESPPPTEPAPLSTSSP